ncbi:class I SAM-dependent methyltransferase [Deinococcus sp.]|uniref:class I SAM-dependent methyltransferase n=1 Tax=Deinococcus sp. TaxID=47478 RepID=UPI0038D42B52
MRGGALDLGSGSGNDTLALLARGWTVTALDASAEALEVVRSRAAPDARLTVVNVPFHRLPRRRYGLVSASITAVFRSVEGSTAPPSTPRQPLSIAVTRSARSRSVEGSDLQLIWLPLSVSPSARPSCGSERGGPSGRGGP